MTQIESLRALLDPPDPSCPDDCEHIECGYVVDLERWHRERSDAFPILMAAIPRRVSVLDEVMEQLEQKPDPVAPAVEFSAEFVASFLSNAKRKTTP